MKTGINNLNKEEQCEAVYFFYLYSFEKYCSACMFYNDEKECPHYTEVDDFTDWKYEIHCDKLYD